MKKLFAVLPFIFGIILILFFWQNTILNISTKMHDWYDGAFMVWTMQNNIKHFASLDFAHLFDTNAMYPFRDSLSFTDHLFIPSLIVFIISLFNKNPLFQFNLVSIINHILVYTSFYILGSRFSKKGWAKLLFALYGSFGPYFFSQFGHLQMVFMWPLILSIYFLLTPRRQWKYLMIAGALLGAQFLTGVYLGLIGLFIMGLLLVSEFISTFDKKKVISSVISKIRELSVVLIAFLIVSSVSLYGYIKVNMLYHPVRDQAEFVTYSAHITDYVLVMFTNSWFNRTFFSPFIGIFNHHNRGELAGFVGVVPLVIGGWWLVVSKKKKLFQKLNKVLLIWVALLIGIGLIFSLGPRMNWNGKYLVTPLPYWLVMKFFPPIAIMRAVSRWYFMVVFAVGIVFVLGLNLIKNKAFYIVLGVLFLLEFYPAPLQVSARNWASPSYLYLQKTCKSNPGAVLVYPFEYRDKANDIGKYLSIKTNTLISSTLYSCPTLSGFSSFEPPLFKQWQEDFDTNGITESNITILKKYSFAYVRVNLDALSKAEQIHPESVIHTKYLQELMRDSNSILYKIIY